MKGRHLQVGVVFIAVCLIAGLALALFSISKNKQPDGNVTSNQTMAAADVPASDTIAPATTSTVAAEQPDFMITDALLRDRPTWEDVGQGPEITHFCEGQTARLTNGTARMLTLNLVPAESDASAPLGIAKPAQTLTFEAEEVGTWNIVDADRNGPLFQYEVTACRNGEPVESAVTPVNEEVSTSLRQGKCRVTVAGTRVIDGACFYVLERGGSFVVADTTDGSGYSAQVEIGTNRVEGRWNGERGGAPAGQLLGTFKRQGPCWGNDGSEICLWAS